MKDYKTIGNLRALRVAKKRSWESLQNARKECSEKWEAFSEVKSNGNSSKSDYVKTLQAFQAAKAWQNACSDLYDNLKKKTEEAKAQCDPEDLAELDKWLENKPAEKKPYPKEGKIVDINDNEIDVPF